MEKEKNNELVDKLTLSVKRIAEKKNKIYFIVTKSDTANAYLYEIYYHATVLKDKGYDASFLVYDENFTFPTWIEKEITNHWYDSEKKKIKHHLYLNKDKFNVSPDDFIIVPEILTPVMDQIKKLPSKNVIFIQSIKYMLDGLVNGVTYYRNFNINSIITTSSILEEKIKFLLGESYKINKYTLSIPKYFKATQKPKKMVVSIIGRNYGNVISFIKMFYLKYPLLSWISFDPIVKENDGFLGLDREVFAERLGENAFTVWLDDSSSFGTIGLEAALSKSYLIGLMPDIIPPYVDINDEKTIGFWGSNVYEVLELTGKLIMHVLLNGDIEDHLNNSYNNSVKYYQDKNLNELVFMYEKLFEERAAELNSAINNILIEGEDNNG